MDCNFTTIKTCELKDSTFRSRILDFGNFNISDYSFSVGFVNALGQKISEQTLEKFGNKVLVPLTSIESLTGSIRAEVWMVSPEGFKDKVIVFDVVISATGCPSDSTVTDGISVTFGGLKVPVVISQSVTNFYLDFNSLTPEQKDELTFKWEDFKPENILVLQQPAIEAAAIAATATQNANEATENAQAATEEAQTATTAANEAAANATTATNNANQSAGLATSAAQEAATATSEAAAAASGANSAAAAATAGAANANEKAQLADTAASNAQAKATTADSAAANANDKAAEAQSAASNADQKAAAAQTATNNANTATGNANTATTNANTAANAANAAAVTANAARGWSPNLVPDTTTIPGKTLLKLQDWINGTGTKPTTNVGQWQTAAGGYTATAADALDLTSIVSTNVSNDVANLTWANKNLNVFTITGRYYFAVNGGLTPNASYNSTPLYRVKEGMKFKNPFMGVGAVAQAVFFKSDNTFLSAVIDQAEITAPAGAFFVGFSRPASSTETIKVQTDFWAMQQDNMVVRYVQAGNKEVTVTSNTGNVLNATAHGFANGDRVILSLVATPANNEIVSIVGRVPILAALPVSTSLGDVGYHVVNATADTFQLAATAGGAPLSVNANPNFTAFKFEKVNAATLTFNGLPASNNYKILISGGCYRLPRYVHPNATSSTGAKVNTTGTAISSGGLQMNTSAVLADGVINIASGKSGFFLTQEYKALAADATGNLVTAIVNDTIFHFSDKRDITQIELTAIGLSNGSVIKVIRE